jgi:methionine-rich copper-binding protein CopC
VRRWVIALMTPLALFVANACFAHAVVVDSAPKNGQTLHTPPQQIELRFNVRIEQSFARASLRSAIGEPLVLKPARSPDAQSARLVIPLPALGSGEYELRYKVLATDGHATEGVLRFRVLR